MIKSTFGSMSRIPSLLELCLLEFTGSSSILESRKSGKVKWVNSSSISLSQHVFYINSTNFEEVEERAF